jgi:hypothetical protein
MCKTEPRKGLKPRLPRWQVPNKSRTALPKVNGAPAMWLANMTRRDVSNDDAYTDGPATTGPRTSCSEGSTPGHPSNADRANGSSFFQPFI